MSRQSIPYDFAGWRRRLAWSVEEACAQLGCSRTHYWKLERTGHSSRVWAWAAYGLEAARRT